MSVRIYKQQIWQCDRCGLKESREIQSENTVKPQGWTFLSHSNPSQKHLHLCISCTEYVADVLKPLT